MIRTLSVTSLLNTVISLLVEDECIIPFDFLMAGGNCQHFMNHDLYIIANNRIVIEKCIIYKSRRPTHNEHSISIPQMMNTQGDNGNLFSFCKLFLVGISI